jgi:hypothetical protein
MLHPMLTLRALDANSSEHLVSGTFSVAGDTLTTMTVLELEPSESSRRRVSCRTHVGAFGCVSSQTRLGMQCLSQLLTEEPALSVLKQHSNHTSLAWTSAACATAACILQLYHSNCLTD